jgi:hypothetical protein
MSQTRIKWKQGEQVDVTLGASAVDFKCEKSVPQGLIQEASLRIFTTAFALGGGSGVTDGEKAILRSLMVKSDLHGQLYINIDGLALYRIMTMLFGLAPKVTAVGSGGFSTEFPLPFGFLSTLRHPAVRPNDMALWSFATKPIIQGTIGILTDVVSGGSPSGTVRIRPTFRVIPYPNPAAEDVAASGAPDLATRVKKSGDRPVWQIEVISTKFPSIATTGLNECQLPVGQGRIPLYLVISERNSSTGAEVSDIFTGDSSNIEVRHGGDLVCEQTKVNDLDGIMQRYLGAALPAGYHFIPLASQGKVLNSIKLDGVTEFKCVVDTLATAATRELRVYMINAIPVDQRASPENQKLALA